MSEGKCLAFGCKSHSGYARWLCRHHYDKARKGRCEWPPYVRVTQDNLYKDHRTKVETALGKPLAPGAVVHHFTRLQLVACESTAYHQLLHVRQRAYEATGDPHKRKCTVCKKWSNPNEMLVQYRGGYQHRECHNKVSLLQRHKKHPPSTKLIKLGPICSVAGCGRPHRAKGLCKHHYDCNKKNYKKGKPCQKA